MHAQDLSLINHLYKFLPIIQGLTTHENSVIGSKAKSLADFMKVKYEFSWLQLILMDLFSKETLDRLNASKVVKNQKILNNLLDGNSSKMPSAYSLEMLFKTLSVSTSSKIIDQSEAEDYLEDFLNREKSEISYQDEYQIEAPRKNMTVEVDVEDLTNL